MSRVRSEQAGVAIILAEWLADTGRPCVTATPEENASWGCAECPADLEAQTFCLVRAARAEYDRRKAEKTTQPAPERARCAVGA